VGEVGGGKAVRGIAIDEKGLINVTVSKGENGWAKFLK
jgi:hypothetical protein